jgi:hypothetical protein
MVSEKIGFETMTDSKRLHAPAAERNREPILEVLRDVMPAPGTILEVASGSGQHGAWFAAAFPNHTWAPSDIEPGALASIDVWGREVGKGNMLPARLLDTMELSWPVADIATDLVAIFNANMIHIAPWAAAEGLLAAAGRLLPGNGILFLYGPFLRDGRPVTDNDGRFDQSLRARDASWGIRDLAEVTEAAAAHGLRLDKQVDMPAGNLSLIFRPAN